MRVRSTCGFGFVALGLLVSSVSSCAGDDEGGGGGAPGGSGGDAGDGGGGSGGTGGHSGSAGAAGDTGGPEVTTKQGVVRGADVGGTRVFKGIPFAAPPVGELRWKPPEPPAAWAGVRDATEFGSVCSQTVPPGSDATGEEDCLFLNVWTPKAPPADPLPVMVWIHGGAFVFGAGSNALYDGQNLVEARNVVVVTINYRLGELGFLSHPALTAESTEATSGNQGILDQIAALRWVRDNIAAFGGDPENVTIFGESAGGASVCVLLVAPAARDLFHRAVSQSGVCLAPLPPLTFAEAEAEGQRLAAAVGCTGSDVLGCLRSKTYLELRDAVVPNIVPGGLFYGDGSEIAMRPVADGTIVPALGSTPVAVPLMLGSNRDEGTLFHAAVLATPVQHETEYLEALTRAFGDTGAAAIAAAYPSADFESPNGALTEVTGDAFFVCPARRMARRAADLGGEVYRYAFEGEPEEVGVPNLGSFHSAEIGFVFGNDGGLLGGKLGAGTPLSDRMMRYWTRFAATGDPNGDADPAWPKYDSATDPHLTLATTTSSGTGYKSERCDFWDTMQP